MPDFSALSSAYSALAAHRRRTEIAGQNIANVDTPGYTRQRVELSAVGGQVGGSSVIAGVRQPAGVNVERITRMADDLLDQQARQASSRSSALAEHARATSGIEQRLGAVGEDSLSGQLEALWNGFADVANDPGSLGARQVVLQQAQRISATVNDLGNATVDQHRAEVATVHQRVGEINDLADGIATLNRTIVAVRATGASPNELVDRQASLLDRLGELVEIGLAQRQDGSISVYVDGHDLVSEGIAKPLTVASVADPALGALGLQRTTVSVATPDGSPPGRELSIRGGSVNGLLGVVNEVLPQHLAQLDAVAASITTTVNDLHVAGAGLDGVAGRRLFEPEPPTARTMRVSADVGDDPRLLAAASPGAGTLDATVATRLAALGDSPSNPALAVDHLMASTGASVASLRARSDAAGAATARAQASAGAASGVNLDEELTNLMESQRAYQAAARLITTVDEMLDTLINRTGLVGR